jgi:hypothetical protein
MAVAVVLLKPMALLLLELLAAMAVVEAARMALMLLP